MDILDLRCFLAVADHLNFTRAADALAMSASPLSRRIKRLENRLNATLFVRSPQGVHLTPAGRSLMPRARSVVEQFDDLRRTASEVPLTQLVLGMVGATPPAVADSAVSCLRAAFPGLDIECLTAMTSGLLGALSNSSVDLALLHGPVADPSLGSLPVHHTRLGVVLPGDHPLATRATLVPADLVGSAFVFPPKAHAPQLYDQLLHQLHACGVERIAHTDDQDPMTMVHRVSHRGELAVSALHDGMHAELFRARGLLVKPVAHVDLSATIVLCWVRPRAAAEPLLGRAVDTLRSAFRAAPAARDSLALTG